MAVKPENVPVSQELPPVRRLAKPSGAPDATQLSVFSYIIELMGS
jgi:hypothetical protein